MMGGVSRLEPGGCCDVIAHDGAGNGTKGYSRGFTAAYNGKWFLITPIIPPGIALILYGLVADVSIGSMFMAGSCQSAVFRHVDRHRMAGSYSCAV